MASASVETYQGDALCVPAPHPPKRAENACHVAAWPVDWRCAVGQPRARGEIRAHISHDIWRAHTPVTSERARFCAAVHAPPRTHANHRTQEDACTPRGDHDQESGSRTCRDGCAKRARSWSRIAPKQLSGLRGSGTEREQPRIATQEAHVASAPKRWRPPTSRRDTRPCRLRTVPIRSAVVAPATVQNAPSPTSKPETSYESQHRKMLGVVVPKGCKEVARR